MTSILLYLTDTCSGYRVFNSNLPYSTLLLHYVSFRMGPKRAQTLVGRGSIPSFV